MTPRFRPPIRRTRQGTEVNLSGDERAVLRALLAEHRDQLEHSTDDPELRRLFPTAYLTDPERDAEYQILARSELMDSRLGALAIMDATLDAKLLDDGQANAWMGAVNQMRLVIGTRLDISEDDDDDELDPDDPDTRDRVLYHYLTFVLSLLIEAAA